MYLVTQSFGRENEYRRVILSVLSFYAYAGLTSKAKVLLFTDNPQYFTNYFAGLPVEFVLLTPEKIRHMRGEIDFLHRMKIALIEEAMEKTQSRIIYADSDTFFITDPLPLLLQVSEQKSFMHLWEYRFEEIRAMAPPAGKTFLDFLALIETKRFILADGSKISVSPEHVSWNAGVMMFHPSHAQLIPDVYTLTDQFYPPTLNHASEQYAFSIMLQNRTMVQACDSVIFHYWYRVKKHIVDDFLEEQFKPGWEDDTLAVKLNLVRKWTKQLPLYFEQHVLTLRDNAIQNFNENKFRSGYKWAVKAISKDLSGDPKFIKDIFYHTKGFLLGRRK